MCQDAYNACTALMSSSSAKANKASPILKVLSARTCDAGSAEALPASMFAQSSSAEGGAAAGASGSAGCPTAAAAAAVSSPFAGSVSDDSAPSSQSKGVAARAAGAWPGLPAGAVAAVRGAAAAGLSEREVAAD